MAARHDYARLKALFSAACNKTGPQSQKQALRALGANGSTIEHVMMLLRQDDAITRLSGSVAAAAAHLLHSRLEPGDRLGAWRLTRELGRGGMGRVFLAERSDGHYEQRAAVKVMLGCSGAQALARMARERQILAKLSHPNIAHLLDGGSTPNGQPYLVMEYVDGQRIDAHCQALGLDLHERLDLFATVCDAVAYAHRHLVIHCDIKPSNVLVDHEHRAMLLDFGIATLQNDADLANSAPAMTPRYASPEQRAGAIPGIATDIYSLGCLLDDLVRPLSHDHRRSAELAAIVARATTHEPEQRYLSVQAFAVDIARFKTHRPLAAVGRRPTYVLRKLVRRRWPWLAAAGTAVLALVTGLGFSVWQWQRAEGAALQSAQVTRYLSDMLASASPSNHGGNWPTVLALLEQSRAELAQRFATEPDTLWQLRQVLASTYRDLNRPDIALPLAEQQLALAQQRYGDRHAHTLEAAMLVGHVLTQLETYDLAIQRLEPLRAAVASTFGMHSRPHERVLRWLGYSYACVGRLDEADRILASAAQLNRTLYADNSEERLMLLNELSVLRVQQGRHREAWRLLKQTAPHWTQLPRGAVQLMLEIRYNLIVLAIRLGEYDGLEADAARFLADIDRVMGKAKLADGLRGEMARYYTETGQFAKALQQREAALAASSGANAQHPAMTLPQRAAVLQAAGLARAGAPVALLREAHGLLAEVDASRERLGYRRVHAWLALARLGLQFDDGALVAAAVRRLREESQRDLVRNAELAARIDQLDGEWDRMQGNATASAQKLQRHARYYEGFAEPPSPRAWSAQLDLAYTLVLMRDPAAAEALRQAERMRPSGAPSGVPLDRVQAYLQAWLTHGHEDAPEVRAARRAVERAFGRDPARPEALRASLGGAFF